MTDPTPTPDALTAPIDHATLATCWCALSAKGMDKWIAKGGNGQTVDEAIHVLRSGMAHILAEKESVSAAAPVPAEDVREALYGVIGTALFRSHITYTTDTLRHITDTLATAGFTTRQAIAAEIRAMDMLIRVRDGDQSRFADCRDVLETIAARVEGGA